jgi:excisionase family DNA binding protein
MKPLLNSKKVCDLLDVKRFTLSRMVHKGTIPYVLLGTGKRKLTVRFREEELEAWIQRRSRGAGGVRRTVQNCNAVATQRQNSPQVVELNAVPLVSQNGGEKSLN